MLLPFPDILSELCSWESQVALQAADNKILIWYICLHFGFSIVWFFKFLIFLFRAASKCTLEWALSQACFPRLIDNRGRMHYCFPYLRKPFLAFNWYQLVWHCSRWSNTTFHPKRILCRRSSVRDGDRHYEPGLKTIHRPYRLFLKIILFFQIFTRWIS